MEPDSKKNNGLDNWTEDRLAALAPPDGWEPNESRGFARFQEGRGQEPTRKKRSLWIVAGAVAAGLPLMAFPATREFAHRCVSACAEQSHWVLDLFAGSPGASSVYIKPGDRKMAPDFTLQDANGKAVRLADFRGKVVLLNFWATWCAPCRVEIPWFTEFQRVHGPQGFATVGISMDEDGWTSVKPFIEQRKVNYRMVIGNDEISQQYRASSLPTTFVIDKLGRIAATHIGLCAKNEYEADITAVLNEQ